jgi:hypothetical protein
MWLTRCDDELAARITVGDDSYDLLPVSRGLTQYEGLEGLRILSDPRDLQFFQS